MGYAADYFAARVASWCSAGWLPPGGKLADLGVQEFTGDEAEALRCTRAFLRDYGTPEEKVDSICVNTAPLKVADVYRAMGMDYLAIDIRRGQEVGFFDLNCYAPPPPWRAAFDLVNDEGAIEHLANPLNGFQVAHELLKIGGVAVHSVPLTGHTEHGLMHPTLTFYRRLVDMNGYELLLSEVAFGQSRPELAEKGFALLDRRGRPLAGGAVTVTDLWLRLAYRKTAAAGFRAPASHWGEGDSSNVAERVAENLAVFSARRLTERGRRESVADGFEEQAELQRREHAHAEKLEDRTHENWRKLQVYEHQHEDWLTDERQRREHEHADSLQQREHRHGNEQADIHRDIDFGHPALLLAGAAVMLFNGIGLLVQTSSNTRWAFACGFIAAFLPLLLVSTQLARQSNLTGAAVRYGSRMLWLAAALLFALGSAGWAS